MKTRSTRKIPRWLRSCALAVLGLVGLCVLLYAALFVASVTGRQSIVVDGVERTYRVHLPKSYDGSQPTPLVLAFHMLTGNGRTMEWITHFNRVADEGGFIVVYPDGYQNSWADGSYLFPADIDYIDDVAFTLALIDELEDAYNLDASRIYATGFSNGGFFAQRLAYARIAAMVFGMGAAIFVDLWKGHTSGETQALGYTYAILFGALFLGLASPLFRALVPEPLMEAPPGGRAPLLRTLLEPFRDRCK